MRASIACPRTGKSVLVEVHTDAKTVSQSWNRSFSMECPHCNKSHAVPYKTVYAEVVLAHPTDPRTAMFVMPPEPPK